MAGANSIDLSQLPPPNAVTPLDFAACVAADKALLTTLRPDLAPALELESEPLVKFIQLLAYRYIQKSNEVNQAVRAVMPALASGADLDHLAVLMGIGRLVIDPGNPEQGVAPTYESDEDLRRRFVLAPEGFSVAGPTGAYVFHALSADGDVLDASATSPAPGQVVVTVLARDGDGEATAELLDAVEAVVSADTVRPLTDMVTVVSAEIIDFAVTASLMTYAGPDPAIVVTAAQASLAQFIALNRRLGRDINRSGLFAALHVNGVQKVTLTQPVADVVVTALQAAHCTAVSVTHGGFAA